MSNLKLEESVDGVDVVSSNVSDARAAIVESLQDMTNAMVSPAVQEYNRSLNYGDGVAQGEYVLQYLGKNTPAFLSNRSPDIQGCDLRYAIGDSSHIVNLSTGSIWYKDVINPLTVAFLFVEDGGRVLIEHDEHSSPLLTSAGYYVVRSAREGAISAADLTQVMRRID